MNIKAKGAFKWGTAGSCASALASYEEAGYGVLAADDWKVAGAYAFIDKELELDVDMVSWRDSFETLAASAQEGEVDLGPGEGSFFRITKTKGKKKIALTTEKTGFGEPHAARVRAWGAAVEKIQKAELKAKQKRDAERAMAEKRAQAILVASHALGEYGNGLVAESDGTVSVLAGGSFHRIGPSGVVFSHVLDRENPSSYSCFARIDDATTAVWDDWSPKIAIVRANGAAVFTLDRAKDVEDDRARVCDVLAGKPGEIIVHERHTLRRLAIDSGREIAQIPFPEIERKVHRGENRRVVGRSLQAVELPEHIAFARNADDTCEIIVFDRNLEETQRVVVPNRVCSLAVQDGKLFAFVTRSYSKAELVPVTKRGLGDALLSLDYEGTSATPLGEGLWTICGGSRSVTTTRLRPHPHSHGWVARVADVMADGSPVIASLEYVGGIDVVREGWIEWHADLGSGINVQGVKAVGEELIAWSYGSPLFRIRAGAANAERLLGHPGRIRYVVALGATLFASLDEKGELRFWDLAKSPHG